MVALVTTPDLLAAVCRRRANLSNRVFAAAVIEALANGVDAKSVLIQAGIVPSSLPRYASFVKAGFFNV